MNGSLAEEFIVLRKDAEDLDVVSLSADLIATEHGDIQYRRSVI